MKTEANLFMGMREVFRWNCCLTEQYCFNGYFSILSNSFFLLNSLRFLYSFFDPCWNVCGVWKFNISVEKKLRNLDGMNMRGGRSFSGREKVVVYTLNKKEGENLPFVSQMWNIYARYLNLNFNLFSRQIVIYNV